MDVLDALNNYDGSAKATETLIEAVGGNLK